MCNIYFNIYYLCNILIDIDITMNQSNGVLIKS